MRPASGALLAACIVLLPCCDGGYGSAAGWPEDGTEVGPEEAREAREDRQEGPAQAEGRRSEPLSEPLPPEGGPDGQAALTGPWLEARERGVDFRALGQEPGWFLEIDEGNRILLALDYGERRISAPAPEPEHEPDEGIVRYLVSIPGDQVMIEVRDEECRDIMSGEPFESTVRVVAGGEEFRGCGRALSADAVVPPRP